MIIDDFQTGSGNWQADGLPLGGGVKSDITAVGKALSGGTMPVSAAFADDHIMLLTNQGDHGSTD